MAKGIISYSELVEGTQKDLAQVGKVSTKSVHKHTGKNWSEWVSLLEKAGARKWKYQQIVAFLKTKYKLTPWWQQGVALGFEIATGRRREGQDAKGNYMVTATKSLACHVSKTWKLLTTKKGVDIWMLPVSKVSIKPGAQFETTDGYFGEIRTMKVDRRVRMTWQDPLWDKPTTVELHLVPRPDDKSILVINHTGLKDLKTKALFRERWRTAIDAIAGKLA